MKREYRKLLKKVTSFVLCSAIVINPIVLNSNAWAMDLPQADVLLKPSPNFSMPVLKGLRIVNNDLANIEFFVDSKDTGNLDPNEAAKLIQYFIAGLTIPEQDLWVNLSPYEEDRVIEDSLSRTDLGQGLLAQDYVLKQLSSSLSSPNEESGKAYWAKLYQKLSDTLGSTKIPVDTFNKIWISPKAASVKVGNGFAYIEDAELKVELEKDWIAAESAAVKNYSSMEVSTEVWKEKILPIIEEEVNEGENFAALRQMYHSMILAAWFKNSFQKTAFKEYFDSEKTFGIEALDLDKKNEVYKAYSDAFSKGVYNIKERVYDQATDSYYKRNYFSGGYTGGKYSNYASQSSALDLSGMVTDGKAYKVSSNIVTATKRFLMMGATTILVGAGSIFAQDLTTVNPDSTLLQSTYTRYQALARTQEMLDQGQFNAALAFLSPNLDSSSQVAFSEYISAVNKYLSAYSAYNSAHHKTWSGVYAKTISNSRYLSERTQNELHEQQFEDMLAGDLMIMEAKYEIEAEADSTLRDAGIDSLAAETARLEEELRVAELSSENSFVIAQDSIDYLTVQQELKQGFVDTLNMEYEAISNALAALTNDDPTALQSAIDSVAQLIEVSDSLVIEYTSTAAEQTNSTLEQYWLDKAAQESEKALSLQETLADLLVLKNQQGDQTVIDSLQSLNDQFEAQLAVLNAELNEIQTQLDYAQMDPAQIKEMVLADLNSSLNAIREDYYVAIIAFYMGEEAATIYLDQADDIRAAIAKLAKDKKLKDALKNTLKQGLKNAQSAESMLGKWQKVLALRDQLRDLTLRMGELGLPLISMTEVYEQATADGVMVNVKVKTGSEVGDDDRSIVFDASLTNLVQVQGDVTDFRMDMAFSGGMSEKYDSYAYEALGFHLLGRNFYDWGMLALGQTNGSDNFMAQAWDIDGSLISEQEYSELRYMLANAWAYRGDNVSVGHNFLREALIHRSYDDEDHPVSENGDAFNLNNFFIKASLAQGFSLGLDASYLANRGESQVSFDSSRVVSALDTAVVGAFYDMLGNSEGFSAEQSIEEGRFRGNAFVKYGGDNVNASVAVTPEGSLAYDGSDADIRWTKTLTFGFDAGEIASVGTKYAFYVNEGPNEDQSQHKWTFDISAENLSGVEIDADGSFKVSNEVLREVDLGLELGLPNGMDLTYGFSDRNNSDGSNNYYTNSIGLAVPGSLINADNVSLDFFVDIKTNDEGESTPKIGGSITANFGARRRRNEIVDEQAQLTLPNMRTLLNDLESPYGAIVQNAEGEDVNLLTVEELEQRMLSGRISVSVNDWENFKTNFRSVEAYLDNQRLDFGQGYKVANLVDSILNGQEQRFLLPLYDQATGRINVEVIDREDLVNNWTNYNAGYGLEWGYVNNRFQLSLTAAQGVAAQVDALWGANVLPVHAYDSFHAELMQTLRGEVSISDGNGGFAPPGAIVFNNVDLSRQKTRREITNAQLLSLVNQGQVYSRQINGRTHYYVGTIDRISTYIAITNPSLNYLRTNNISIPRSNLPQSSAVAAFEVSSVDRLDGGVNWTELSRIIGIDGDSSNFYISVNAANGISIIVNSIEVLNIKS